MTKNDAVLNRQALALFNLWLKKQPKNKHIGELTIGDFVEMCGFLMELKTENTEDQNQEKRETVARQIDSADALHTFYFEGQKIRIVMKDGRPWFVLDDVCKVFKINPNELSENELEIAKIDLNNAKCNLIDFNSAKTNNGEHNGK
jgi:hypothetical protein